MPSASTSISKNVPKDSKSKNRKSVGLGLGKKPVPGPTHLGHFLVMLAMNICQKILFVDISIKVFLYFGTILTLSVVSNIFVVPKSYLSQKRNIFNDYFLKLGWGWTLFTVGTYIFFSSLVYCSRDFSKIMRHGMRLAVGTFWWYFCTTMFRKIELTAGSCSEPIYGDPKSCFKGGKFWRGFDVSGHVFLEVFCSLVILEEMKTFKEWKKLGIRLDDEDLKDRRNISEEKIIQARADYKIFTPCIKLCVVVIAIISVLYDLMLVTSSIYPFHSLSEELLAFFTAITAWFLSYRVFFRQGRPYPFLPCPIGDCTL